MGQRRHIRFGHTTAKIREDRGRTPGIQHNDASETFAIQQNLLNKHTTDDLELYCDNQGCVNIWDRMIAQHDAGSGSGIAHRGGYAAMWNRIDRVGRDSTRKGSITVMSWIQSHVQDEAIRVSTSSNIECTCKAASGCELEYTMPGDRCHWMHEGNA